MKQAAELQSVRCRDGQRGARLPVLSCRHPDPKVAATVYQEGGGESDCSIKGLALNHPSFLASVGSAQGQTEYEIAESENLYYDYSMRNRQPSDTQSRTFQRCCGTELAPNKQSAWRDCYDRTQLAGQKKETP